MTTETENIRLMSGIRKKKFGSGSPNSDTWIDGEDGFRRTDKGVIIKTDPRNIVEAVDLLKIKLRHNEFSNQTKVWGLGKVGAEFQDHDACRLRFLIHETYEFLPGQELFEAVLMDIAHQNSFHPVRDYLDARTWDGVARLDNWLVSYGGAEDTAFNRAVGRIFLIAAVRRVRKPGVKFDTMMVWESPQGRNKSQAARVLATREDWFNDNLPIGAKPQEVIEHIEGSWIIEFPELAGLGSREVEHVKAFMSRQVDKARPAYGRRRQDFRRQFVAIGTTNDEEYLSNDERRFLPVRIGRFDIDWLRADIDQLWAEASHYEELGEPITLSEDLWPEAAQVRSARTFENPFQACLSEHFSRRDFCTAQEVWECLGIARENRQKNGRNVGKAMRFLGFSRRQASRDGRGMKVGDWFYEKRLVIN
jgi:predicted P-loop ATPase